MYHKFPRIFNKLYSAQTERRHSYFIDTYFILFHFISYLIILEVTRLHMMLKLHESILMGEETRVHSKNPQSQVEIKWKTQPTSTSVVEVGGMIYDLYASLTHHQ